MRDVSYGWMIRYLHANGAAFFFIFIYIHMAKGLYYGSYKAPRVMLWSIGVIIFLLLIITGFLGCTNSNIRALFIKNSKSIKYNNLFKQFRYFHNSPLLNIKGSENFNKNNQDNNQDNKENNKVNLKTWLESNKPSKFYLDSKKCKNNIYIDNKNMTGIYLWYNNLNGKYYVGSANNLTRRLSTYYSVVYLNNADNAIHRAILKYNHENFSLYILEYCSPEKLIEREQFYIDMLTPLYNALKIAGSSLGFKHSEETAIRISEAQKGVNNSMYGRSGEDSPKYGKKHSEETLLKISTAMKGENNPFFNRNHSQESRVKLAAKASKKVFVYDINEPLILYKEFSSYTEAAKFFNCIPSTISNYVNANKIFKNQWRLYSNQIKN